MKYMIKELADLMEPSSDADVALGRVEGGCCRRADNFGAESAEDVHLLARHLLRHHDDASECRERVWIDERTQKRAPKVLILFIS